MATIADVAKRAKVSKATASRVLSGRHPSLVTPETAERVRRAAAELKYQPHPVASALATGRTGVIGLWMRNVHRPFFAEVMRHVSEQSRARQVDLIIIEQGHVIVNEETFAPTESQWPVDGIIAHEPPGVIYGHPVGKWPSTPVVTIAEGTFTGTDAVFFDVRSGARRAIEHLWQQGCRRIGYLAQSLVFEQRRARMSAYTAAAAELGFEPVLLSTGDAPDTCETGMAAATEHLAEIRSLDGLFCHNDELAIGVIRAVRDVGVRVPQELAIVGCDGIAIGPYVEPPLTTIRIPIAEMIQHAAAMLFDRIADPSQPHRSVTLPTELVVRRSSLRNDAHTPQEEVT